MESKNENRGELYHDGPHSTASIYVTQTVSLRVIRRGIQRYTKLTAWVTLQVAGIRIRK